MKRDISKITRKSYDLIIVGAGMFGACAAWEATQRGLSVLLVEKGDFCGATSANHLKMVHGGIRYLQHGDIYRVRESVFERSAFLRIAPHLVQPLPVVMPTYGHGMKGKEILRTGMSIYDLLTFDRNYNISDKSRKIPNCYSISKDELLTEFPGVIKEELTGAAVFTDAQMYNPPRLVLSFIKTAVENGAEAMNYGEVVNFIKDKNKVKGVVVKDLIDKTEIEVLGKHVLNTSGPWSYNLLKNSLRVELLPKPSFSRDAAFVIKKQLNSKFALATALKTKDVDAVIDRGGRHVFIAPWLGKKETLIGVWHIVWGESENKLYVKEDELKSFINEVNVAYPNFNLSLDDVSMINTGLTLFGETKPGSTRMSFGKRSRIIDHEKEHGVQGITSLIGVRATVARWNSKRIITDIASKIGKNIDDSKTHKIPIYGGNISDFHESLKVAISENLGLEKTTVESLLHNYGSKYKDVLNLGINSKDYLEKIVKTDKVKAEIIHAVREEMALRLDDVLVRRTDIGTAGKDQTETIHEVASIIANELKWDENKKDKEIFRYIEKKNNNSSYKNYEFA